MSARVTASVESAWWVCTGGVIHTELMFKGLQSVKLAFTLEEKVMSNQAMLRASSLCGRTVRSCSMPSML